MKNSQREIVRKALEIAGVGANLQGYLPQPLAAQVIAYIRDLNLLRKILPSFNQPARIWTRPKKTSGMNAYYIPDGTTATQTQYSTAQVQWIAKKLMSFVMVDAEAIEDSIANVQEDIMTDFGLALAEAEERSFLTGDPTHTATAPTPESASNSNWYVRDPRLMHVGMFTMAASNSAATSVNAGNAVFNEDFVNKAIYNLGKYGRNKARLFGLVGPLQAANIRSNPLFKQALQTGFALSAAITGLGSAGEGDGMVLPIYGVKFYEFPWAPDDSAVVTRRDVCSIGDRRQIKLRRMEVIESDQDKFVISERISLAYEYPDAMCAITNINTAVRIN